MQIIAFLMLVMGIYAILDNSQTDAALTIREQAGPIAKQLEYYHARAVTLCASPAAGCASGVIPIAQLPGDAWVYGADIVSATDGAHIATTWHLRSAMAAIDANHLYGNVSAILRDDTAGSFSIGAYDAATGSVGGGTYHADPATGAMVHQEVTIATPFAGMAIANGAPVLVTPVSN